MLVAKILRRSTHTAKSTRCLSSTRNSLSYRPAVVGAGGSTVTFGLVCWALYRNDVTEPVMATTDRLPQRFQQWTRDVYVERILHSSLFRFGRAAFTVVSVIVDYKFSLRGKAVDEEDYKDLKSQCHLRSAVKFRDLCSLNGGVFMKVAQHIGSLEFLFPKEYTETLKCFQYEAPESPFDDIKYVIENETGRAMSELFEAFVEKPLGSASLAQVHRAILKSTGKEVAVKVQHKSVKKHAFQDAEVIQFFVGIASRLFPEFQFQWLVDQIKQNLPLELDFLREGKNCEKMRDILKSFPNIKVPEVYWEDSTNRVLFMEYCVGGIVDDMDYIKKHNIDVNDISVKLGKLYSEMIYVKGFIHCDPHPGNILIRKKENTQEVVLLDHGLYLTMKDSVRLEYCKLWQSIIEMDVAGIEQHSIALGVGEYYPLLSCIVTGRSWDSIQSGIGKKHVTSEELKEVQDGAIQYFSVITEIFERLPREMILIFKTNDLLRGLDARLNTRTASASFLTMSKYCLRALYKDERAKCNSWVMKLKLDVRHFYDMSRLVIYQLSSSHIVNVLRSFTDTLANTLADFTGILANSL